MSADRRVHVSRPARTAGMARVARVAHVARVAPVAVAIAMLAAVAAPAAAETWDFEVRLDDKPIGTHRFVVDGGADAREVQSTARFDVKLLGITVYRYRHEARERWRGDCLDEIRSSTDDDGKVVGVDLRAGDAKGPIAGCVMSYAYWNPALVRQTRLLNPQTGRVDDARFERLPDATLRVNGREVPAIRWHLSAQPSDDASAKQDLTLWLSREDGRWIGLDARVKGDKRLTYRLP